MSDETTTIPVIVEDESGEIIQIVKVTPAVAGVILTSYLEEKFNMEGK